MKRFKTKTINKYNYYKYQKKKKFMEKNENFKKPKKTYIKKFLIVYLVFLIFFSLNFYI